MKPCALAAFVCLLSSFTLHAEEAAATAPAKPQQLTSPDQVPEGLAKSDWQSIRAAYEAGRHAFMPIEGGWQARNPGQQWTTRFDGRGFVAQPRDGGWQWGLELNSYGFGERQTPVSGTPAVKAAGQRLSYQWDATVQEWWVNDQRGLEHGFTLAQRPSLPVSEAPSLQVSQPPPLAFTLATRGTLIPKVTDDAQGVLFQDAAGATVLNYTGLKVWDADGKTLTSRFEAAGENRVRLLVDERSARYPITIDPIAQQAYVKPAIAGNSLASDHFGNSVAISGDTVVVGAYGESSSTTGINSSPNESAYEAGAAYVFVRNAGVWTQQAYLKPAAVGTSQGGDWFGVSVAISGDTLIVGALGEASSTTGINTIPNESAANAGAAYIFIRSGTTWTQQAYLKPAAIGTAQYDDFFGGSVAISGDTVVVGAPYEKSSTTGINSAPNESSSGAGATYIFVRNAGVWTQQAYLKPAAIGTDQAGDGFGVSVAIAGDTVVVGAYQEDSSTTGINSTPNDTSGNTFDSGAAYVFGRSGTTWSQQAYLKPAAVGTSQQGDFFGSSVAISGNTVVVGAWGEKSSTTGVNSTPNESSDRAGASYVFMRSGTTWTQQAYLKPAAVGTTQAGDGFGNSVAISGDTVVIGAWGEASSTAGVNSTPNESSERAGAAYVFIRSGTTWTQQAYLKPAAVGTTQVWDGFGGSVAISGDTVIVGASEEDSSTTGINSALNESSLDSGASYVFTRSGTTWNQQAYVKATPFGNTQAGDGFGSSVSISGDTVVVGAYGEDSSTTGVNSTPNESGGNSGAVYVFTRSGTMWSQQAYLKPAAIGTTQQNDYFGISVAIAGDTVVVGASGEDSSTTGINSAPNESAANAGAAYVFTRSGTTWMQQAYLKPAAVGTTQAADEFGSSVAVSGDTVIVGAKGESSSTTGINTTPNESASQAGAAYVFTRSGTTWTQQAYLKPAAVGTTQAGDSFGVSVAVSDDTAVVGAYGEDSSTTGINGTPNESANGSGAAYVFTRSGTAWTQQAYLKPAAVGTTQASDYFGTSVGVSGDTVTVGAPYEDSNTTGVNSMPNESASEAGAAYVFIRSGTTWSQQSYLKPAAFGTWQVQDYFGRSVAVSGNTVVVGADGESSSTIGINSTPNDDGNAIQAGAAYVFVRTGAEWSQHSYLKPAAFGTTQAGDRFGSCVAVSGGMVIVGAVEEGSGTTGIDSTADENGILVIGSFTFKAGAAYIFGGFPAPPSVNPTASGAVAATSVTLNGTVNPNEAATTAQFEYGLTTSYGSFAPVTLTPNDGGTTQAVSVTLTGLLPGTTYHYRLTATNSNGIASTVNGSFTTLSSGALDTSFSGDGIQSTAYTYAAQGRDVAVQADGKTVIAGWAGNGTNDDSTILRYGVSGTLDSSFGSGGRVTTALGTDDGYYAVTIQPDGKIVAAGTAHTGTSNEFSLVRYNTNGSLDPYFDSNPTLANAGTGSGKVFTAFDLNGPASDVIYDIAIQPDGRIVAVGYANKTTGKDLAIARYNANGSPDTSYSGDGKLNVMLGSGESEATSVAVQSNGLIVVGANIFNGTNWDIGVLRYLADGNPDGSFDGDGKIVISVGTSHDFIRSIAIQSDGKIVAAGEYINAAGDYDGILFRFNADGSNDTTFDGDGRATYAFGASHDYLSAVTLQPGDRIMAVGRTRNGSYDDMAILRVNANGSLDTTFDDDGKKTIAPGSFNDRLFGVAASGIDKIVAAGLSDDGTGKARIAAVRLLAPQPIALGTQVATSVGTNTAMVNGSVNPNGASTSAWFEYGLTTSYGSSTSSQAVGSDASNQPVSANLTGLSSGTLYHYRVVAQNSVSTSYGANMTFITAASNTPQQNFTNAMTAAGLTGPNAALDATPFNDGVKNLLKYAFNMNLSGPDSRTMAAGGSSGLPGITTQPNGASSIFRYEFLRRKNSGLIYTPQKSVDISTPALWTPLTDTPTVISIDANWERVIYEEPYNAATTPRCFGRVQVSLL